MVCLLPKLLDAKVSGRLTEEGTLAEDVTLGEDVTLAENVTLADRYLRNDHWQLQRIKHYPRLGHLLTVTFPGWGHCGGELRLGSHFFRYHVVGHHCLVVVLHLANGSIDLEATSEPSGWIGRLRSIGSRVEFQLRSCDGTCGSFDR